MDSIASETRGRKIDRTPRQEAENARLDRDKDMYALLAGPSLSDKDIRRYLASGERVLADLSKVVTEELDQNNGMVINRIEYLPNHQRVPVILQALQHDDPRMAEAVAKKISHLSESELQQLASGVRKLVELSEVDPDSWDPRAELFRKLEVSLIKYLPADQKAPVILKALEDGEHGKVVEAAKEISQLSEAERIPLQKRLAELITERIKKNRYSDATTLIPYAAEQDGLDFIEEVLKGAVSTKEGEQCLQDFFPRLAESVSAFATTPPSATQARLQAEITRLCEEALNATLSSSYHDWTNKSIAVDTIQFLDATEQVRLFNQALQDTNAQWSVIKLLPKAPAEIQTELAALVAPLLERSLSTINDHALTVIPSIPLMPEPQRARLAELSVPVVEQAIKKCNPWAIAYVPYTPVEARAELIKLCFSSTNSTLRAEAGDYIPYAAEADVAELITIALQTYSSMTARFIYSFIPHAAEADRGRLIEPVLSQVESVDIAMDVVSMIPLAAEADRQRLLDIAKQSSIARLRYSAAKMTNTPFQIERPGSDSDAEIARLKTLATSTPLYDRAQGRFVRQQFFKEGSRTTLLDQVPGQLEKSFRDRVIIRHIQLRPWLTWKKAYDASAFWKQQGFDYVPVEPIVRTMLNRASKEVDVYTRVIQGPSLGTWEVDGGLFLDEIDEQVEKIKSGLEQLHINHGHPHTLNFLLEFERDAAGEVLLDRPPRVYVIDFDEATIFKPDKPA